MSAAERLAAGIAAMGLAIDSQTQQRLLAYGALLLKWNKVYNLSAIRDEAAMVDLHLLDSLAVLPWIGFERLADIGTGGGLPGIPLAICRPGMTVELVEAVSKKASFLQQARIELKLLNIVVHNVRVENLQPTAPFSAVISRAFSSLHDFVSLTDHLVASDGLWLAMKGVYPEDEIAQLPGRYRVSESHRLVVPGVAAERHLLLISRN